MVIDLQHTSFRLYLNARQAQVGSNYSIITPGQSADLRYSLGTAIAEFFSQTFATREVCDTRAKDMLHGHLSAR
jgi:hypothetical protein